jgi:hypothetical protein
MGFSMENKTPITKKERNQITFQRHRKEVFWQITAPIGIGGLFLLVLSVLAIFMEPGEISRWADISLIWLIIPAMLVTFITFVMLAASIYGIIMLIQVLPYYSLRLLNWFILVGGYVRDIGNRAVDPVLRLKSFNASLKTLGRQISRK